MKRKGKYKEGEGYNMCQAIREMIEDGRMEGKMEEQAEGIRIFIQSHRDDGATDGAIVEKLQKYYSMTEEKAWEILRGR